MTVQPPPPSAKHVEHSALLQVERLTRRFGGLVAVNSISFDVGEGEIFGLIGPNGAGKTTLFNMLTGLQRPSSGYIRYRGDEISRLRPDQIARRGVARTFQNIRLFGNLSALDNVMIAQHIHTRSGILSGVLSFPLAKREEARTRERARELLDLVGLLSRAHDEARTFPYGGQRRLEIARALALEPSILLLDEPAAGMNPNEKRDLSIFIREIRTRFKLTVLLIEHHVPLVMGLCDRIAVLNFGEMIALGVPAQVRQHPAVIDAYLGAE